MGNLMSGLVRREKVRFQRSGYGFTGVRGNLGVVHDSDGVGNQEIERTFELAAFVVREDFCLVAVFREVLPGGFDEVEELFGFFRSFQHHVATYQFGTFVDAGSGENRRHSEGNLERCQVPKPLDRFLHAERHAFAHSRPHHSEYPEAHSTEGFPNGIRVDVEQVFGFRFHAVDGGSNELLHVFHRRKHRRERFDYGFDALFGDDFEEFDVFGDESVHETLFELPHSGVVFGFRKDAQSVVEFLLDFVELFHDFAHRGVAAVHLLAFFFLLRFEFRRTRKLFREEWLRNGRFAF